ncbi:hypothetical protein [Dactylosporangium sp. NPDC005555]|uniref:hypothetical protein n=1 Tax=Dactylosporangium sp. NPDC005555 TaxID=3154889 RepID=UPI0033A9F91A
MSEPPRPWWRPDRRDALVVLLLAAITAYLHWPRPPDGPVELLRQGTVAGTGWSVTTQRAGSKTCLQVRVAGAGQALMCDQHWDRDVHRLWRGPVPATGGTFIGPPSLLVVRFPAGDQVLVASVLDRDIATLSAPGVQLRTAPLPGTGLGYVAGTLTAGDAAALQAFSATGEPLFYHYVEAQ